METSLRSLALAVCTLAYIGCASPSDPDASSDGGADVIGQDTPLPTCERTFTLEPGTPEGHSEPLGATAMQARAGRLTAAMLPADATGLALVTAGDYVLANSRVAIMIEGIGTSDLYLPWGGGRSAPRGWSQGA